MLVFLTHTSERRVMNYLHFGDCIDVLRAEIPSESVDLIYIDPPFNSKRNYNIFFDDKDIQTQRIAFEDTWSLKNLQDSLFELEGLQTEKLHRLLMTYQEVASSAFPYLVMMSLRIVELHRVLKPNGSFYLHCDPTMSHYLKTLCDIIFGVENFRNEIIWCYRKWAIIQKQFVRNHDVVLFYSRSNDKNLFIPQFIPLSEGTLKRWKGKKQKAVFDETGKRSASNEKEASKGSPMPDWWEISILNPASKERLGYPTQKPKALLERIIKASSNEGDIVLDAFCGCGTSIDVAEELNRKWIGIDISPIAINLIQRRLKDTYGRVLSKYEVRGVPKDEVSAVKLWQQNPFAFQDWWITEFEAFSTTYGKKGADKGVDGVAKYLAGPDKMIKAAFQVKGGKVQSKDIDALLGAMVKHKCELGVFLTINPPTKPMLETTAASGFLDVPGFKYPKLQIATLSDFFGGRSLKLPQNNITFASAKLKGKGGQQLSLI